VNFEPEYTESWFHGSEVLQKYLGHLKGEPDLRYLEIGVFEGKSAVWVMENILTGKNCVGRGVDPYIFTRKRKTKKAEEYYQRALANLKPFVFILNRMTSLTYLANEFWQTGESYFDIINIDGDHNAMTAWADIVLCWPLLKDGGYMMCDDYYLKDTRGKRTPFDVPKPAIDKFLLDYEGQYELLHKGKIVLVKKAGN